MKEEFLHYIWQYQYFRKEALFTSTQEELTVLHPGFYNRSDAGPDFASARLKLDGTEWVGSVELHLKSSDWHRHRHQEDAKYNQVVLHVVWENDTPIYRQDSSLIPALELKDRVDISLMNQYTALLWSRNSIPCAEQVSTVDTVFKSAMMDRALLERLEAKADLVLGRLSQNKQDWESTVYQTLAAGFGFKINQEGFMQLSRALPWTIVQRYRSVPKQLEALVFGQAGMLREPSDAYLQELSREHAYLAHKHQLSEPLPMSSWNMLRLRPANFPAIRLGQWLAILQAQEHLWSGLNACEKVTDYLNFFRQTPPAYWQVHYAPNQKGQQQFAKIGEESIRGLLINVVTPLLMAYSRRMDDRSYQEKAVRLLESIPKENNKFTRLYEELDFQHICAADSQALLGLYQGYCQPKNCLHCSIGHRLFKQHQPKN